MHSLESGQDAMLSWQDGSMSCRVIAAAGRFVLLRPERSTGWTFPHGECSLTYLDGYIPMGFDGVVEVGAAPGEYRFRVHDRDRPAERRATARVAADAPVLVETASGEVVRGRLFDVSAGGMRFRHASRIGGPGQTVRVVCELDGGVRIDADAVICGADVGVSSVRFLAQRDADVARIGAWTIDRLREALTPA